MKRMVLTPVVAVVALLASTFVGVGTAGADPVAEGPATGWLRVVTDPPVPSRMSIDGQWSNTWAVNGIELPAGEHTVCFGDVPGWTAPSCGTVEVVADMVHEIAPSFEERGWLQVQTEPAVPALITVDGAPANNWGVYTDLPTGAHTVCFGAVDGYEPPDCEDVTVTAGATTTVVGEFSENPSASGFSDSGMLRVETVPAVASQISIDGHVADTWGLDWVEMLPGTHEVCFGDVAGFSTPECETVTVTEGETTEVTGAFARQGYLQVDTDPALPGQIRVDGVVRDGWGIYTAVDVGTHEVCFDEIDGLPWFEAPECATVTVTAGQTTTVTGEYADTSQETVGTWVELRTPDGTASWLPEDTNRNGLVVGQGYWCKDACTASSALSGASAQGYVAIDDKDAIVGYDLSSPGTPSDAWVWTSPTANAQKVTLPPGWSEPRIAAVNSDGSLVGSGLPPGGPDSLLLLWTSPGAQPEPVDVPAGWSGATVEAYSQNAKVAGTGFFGGRYRTFMSEPSDDYQPVALADVDETAYPAGAVGVQITDSGGVLGFIVEQDLALRTPVVWPTRNSSPIVLELPAGHVTNPDLLEMLDSGAIVGIVFDQNEDPHVAVWESAASPMRKLDPPTGGWVMTEPVYDQVGLIASNTADSNGRQVVAYADPGATGKPLSTPPGYTDAVAFGISADGAIYAMAQDSTGVEYVIVWPTIDAEPVVATLPDQWTDVIPQVPANGGPVVATGFDANGTRVGLVFRL